MAVDVGKARGVVLDLAERCAEIEADLAERLAADFLQAGGTIPPKGHELREEFETWAAEAGCLTRGGLRAPVVNSRPLFRLPKGRWISTPTGKQWTGEEISWEDGGYSGAGAQVNDWWPDWLDRTARDIATLFELRRFVAHPPTTTQLAEGWHPPCWLPLEEHESAILAGIDVESGLPAEVAAWLSRLLHEPKREYARAYCGHRLWGDPEPDDPGAPWAAKARKRADRVLAVIA